MISDIFHLMDHIVDFFLPRKKDILQLEQTYLPLFLNRKKRHVPRNASTDLDLDLLLTILHRNLDPESMLRVLNKLFKKFKGHPKLKQVLKRWLSVAKKQKKLALRNKMMRPGLMLDDLDIEALVHKLKKFLRQENVKLQKFDKKQLRKQMLKDQSLKMDMLMHFLILDFAIQQQAIRDHQLKMQMEVKKAQELTHRLQREHLVATNPLTNPALNSELPSELQMILEFQTQLQLEQMRLQQNILEERQMMEALMLNSMLEEQQMIALWQQHQLLYQAQVAQMQYLERLHYQFQQMRIELEQNQHDVARQATTLSTFANMEELLRHDPVQGLDILSKLHYRLNQNTNGFSDQFNTLYGNVFADLKTNDNTSLNALNQLNQFFKSFLQLVSFSPTTFSPPRSQYRY